MCGTAVCSFSHASLPLCATTSSPAAPRLSPSVSARRPMAVSTVSNSSSPATPPSPCDARHCTRMRPPSVRSSLAGTNPRRNRVPWPSMYSPILSAHSRSNPRSRMDRTITVVLYPSAARNPAHSSATYEAPTTSVLPGGDSSENMSSLVIASSAPSQSSGVGRPPTATTNRRAFTIVSFPDASRHATVCGSTNRPSAFRYVTFLSRSSTRYLKLSPAI
mmetsp:Transcript_24278/g.77958  ORF Transcript_24278/g.77958 Transcript_24278/m.77958 type:complete len:219 (+) Transcript_24278:543-1199(+)